MMNYKIHLVKSKDSEGRIYLTSLILDNQNTLIQKVAQSLIEVKPYYLRIDLEKHAISVEECEFIKGIPKEYQDYIYDWLMLNSEKVGLVEEDIEKLRKYLESSPESLSHICFEKPPSN